MRKTKIIATLGPVTDQVHILRDILEKGVNVARFNFSHGNYEEHKERLELLIKTAKETNKNVASLMDTKGPEIRTREVEGEEIILKASDEIIVTSRDVLCTSKVLSITYDRLPKILTPGAIILVDDGLISLEVVKIIDQKDILCTIINSGKIKSRRGVNVPGYCIDLPNPTRKDKEDIKFAVENNFDFIAVSFVQNADTILNIKKYLREIGGENIRVISKIENHAGLDNFDSILNASDGIMVARGDLGVELPLEDVPTVQKSMINKCFTAGKPVITATQMLHTMIDNPRPTRAEVSDIANAIYDSTSAIMLSGETSIGEYPVKCVEVMSNIANKAEKAIDYRRNYFNSLKESSHEQDVTNAVTNAALTTAYEVGAKAIITVTETGYTARMLSKMRPEMPIIAICSRDNVLRQLEMNWGVCPIKGTEYDTLDEIQEKVIELSLQSGLVENGDIVIIVAGVPVGIAGATNLIKVEIVGNVLVKGECVTKGKAKGRICLANSPEELKLNFKEKDIVVVKFLDESILSLLKDASGIIIEDDDSDGRGNIIGRTLDIPVMKNARSAYDILKNGIMVTLDTNEGSVTKV